MSRTVTVKVADPVLPAVSVAEQVTVVVPSGKVLPDAGIQTGVIEPSTVSVAVAVNVTTAPAELVASAVISAGTVTTGSVVSRTVTVKVADPVLPAVSVAEQVTVVVPSGKVLPDAGVQTGVIEPSTVSVAVAVNVTTAPAELVASVVISAGTVTTGSVVSRTVTVKVADPVLPAVSVAEQVTVVVPSGKVLPDAGVQTGVIEPSTVSVAVAVNVTTAPAELVASAIILAGTVTTGSVVSRTVTVKVADPVLPAVSVAEQVTVVVPSGKVLPDAGVQTGVIEPSTVSVAVAVNVTTAPAELVASVVISAGTVTTGSVVSRTVTVKVADPVLPAVSVAEQVTVVVPSGKVLPDAGVQTGVIEPSTVSVAVAVNVTTAPAELVASVVISAGTVTTGSVVSRTVTVKVADPVLPAVSVAEQVTVVVPSGKVLPDAGVQTGVIEPSTVSVAVAVNVTTAPAELVASATMFAGTVTTGSVVSRTVTVKVADPVLPAVSVAEQVTVVVPSGKVLPDAGVQTGVIEPSTVSVAVAVNVTTAPAELVASATMFAGTVTTGSVVSRTVTVKVADPVLPAVSVAEQVTVVVT